MLDNMVTASGFKPKKDIRDKGYNHAKIFGAPSPLLLPKDGLKRKPIAIYDQQGTNFCTAYSTTAASSFQEGVALSPEFQTAKTGQIVGKPIINGADLRDALKSTILFGSIEQKDAPYSLDNTGNKVANWFVWPDTLTTKALDHAKSGFYDVKAGPYDIFDNIRSALYQAKDKNGVVVVGTPWYEIWNEPKAGVVFMPPFGAKTYLAHAWTIIDFTDDYLVAQLSQGTGYGDKGLLYFPREVINFAFKEAWSQAFILRDKEDNTSWLLEAYRIALSILYRLQYNLKFTA